MKKKQISQVNCCKILNSWNSIFQNTFETHKQSFISAFLICMTEPLNKNVKMINIFILDMVVDLILVHFFDFQTFNGAKKPLITHQRTLIIRKIYFSS